MRILGIIPARYASTRFPGKPLAMIGKQSMIERVVEQCRKASRLDGILVATDDERIFDHVHSFGAEAVMTSSDHQSGTERCLEAADTIAGEIDAVINIQGDEPFIQPDQIDTVAGLIEDGAEIATLARKQDIKDIEDPNKVKVVKDCHDRALYFSRSPIPHYREASEKADHFLKHLGIYGYRYGTLRQIAKMAPGQLEQAEKLEQLRWMENGFSIHVGMTDYESPAIDSPEDLRKVLAELRNT